MTESPEYKYWEMDNKKLEIKDQILPSWVATVVALEALEADLKDHYPDVDG